LWPDALAELYLSAAQLDLALEHYEQAAKLDSKRAVVFSRIGSIHLLQGKKDEALEAFERALALDSTDGAALEGRGEIYLKQGKIDEAVKDLRAALGRIPEASKPALLLTWVQELSRRQRSVEALELLQEQVAKGVQSPALWAELGDRSVEMTKFEQARDAYVEALKDNNSDASLWELLAELQLKLGDLDAAESAFQKSLSIKDRAVVHIALARICEKRKDLECLTHELDHALKIATGEETREVLDLSDLLASVGRKKDALALLSQLASEEEQRFEVALQLKAAKLARDVKDLRAMKQFCANVSAADAGVARCP
jgi:tetratricopeptide (TPR) repeat protein